MKIKITTLDNGDKEISLPELNDRLAVSDSIFHGVDFWDIMRELFKPTKFTHFNAGKATYLKEMGADAPSFAVKLDTMDDGTRLVIGDFWMSMESAQTCANRLAVGESIIYNLIKF